MLVVCDPSEDIKKAHEVSQEDMNERVFVFESDSETELRTTKQGGGVQLISLRKWWKVTKDYYKTEDIVLVWRKLENFKMTKEINEKFDKFLLENAGKHYKFNVGELVLSTVGKNKKEKLESTFCSELVADSLKMLGLLGNEKLSNNYVPRDFTSMFTKDGKDFKFMIEEVKLTSEIRIKFLSKEIQL